MKTEILGVRFDDLSPEEMVHTAASLIEAGGFHYAVTPNPEFILAAEKNEAFRTALNQADRDVLSAQVQEQEEINAALADDIANSDDPEYLANIARIKLGLLKPDEIEFVDTSH